jgi:hypothetical protein
MGFAMVMLIPGSIDFGWSRRFRRAAQEPFAALARAVEASGATRALVFVPPGATQDPHLGLVRNVTNPQGVRALYVHDRGEPLNDEVRRAFPDRKAYRYVPTEARLHRMGEP